MSCFPKNKFKNRECFTFKKHLYCFCGNCRSQSYEIPIDMKLRVSKIKMKNLNKRMFDLVNSFYTRKKINELLSEK
jgi:hypothetical protein